MQYEDRMPADTKSPNLEEMTTTAIKYLQKKSGDKGFFLMVEGGLIDHAHHGSKVHDRNFKRTNVYFYSQYFHNHTKFRPLELSEKLLVLTMQLKLLWS